MRPLIAPALVFVLVGCGSAAVPDGPRVGMLLPFTGGTAAVGANLEHGALSARELAGVAGDTLGGPIRLITKDTHGDLERTRAAVDDLLEAGVVAIVGPEGAELALEILPTLEDAGVVFVSPMVSSGTQPSLEPETPWFRTGPSVEIVAKTMARDLLRRSGGVVAILHEVDDHNSALALHLERTLIRENGAVVGSIALPPDQSSYRAQLEALLQTEFDAIALITSPKGGALVINELQFIRPEPPPLFFGPALQTDAFLQNTATQYIEGARGVAPSILDHDPAFDTWFRERWGESPLTGAYFYYDASALLVLGLAVAHRQHGDPSYSDLCAAIRTVSRRDGLRADWSLLDEAVRNVAAGEDIFYSGLTGTMLMDEVGQRLQAGAEIWTVHDGRIAPAE